MRASLRVGAALALVVLHTALAGAQSFSQRGFVDASALLFPATTPSDSVRAVGDLRVRDEVFVSASSWLRLAAGVEARANSHEQVDARWRLDADDRGLRRPALSLRRATATITRGPLTLDLGVSSFAGARPTSSRRPTASHHATSSTSSAVSFSAWAVRAQWCSEEPTRLTWPGCLT